MTDLKIIVGHLRPAFTPWAGHRFATFEPEQESDFALPAWDRSSRELYDRTLGEYYYLFALRRALEGRTDLTSITVSQYRRFVTVTPVGVPAANQDHVQVVTPAAAAEAETGLLVREKAKGWLIPTALSLAVPVHFDMHHILRDYYRFLADSYDAGALNRAETLHATSALLFIASSSIGVFPAQTLLAILTKMEACVEAFVAGGYVPREGYQRRVIGFCLERLQSMLILHAMREDGLHPSAAYGFQTVVSETQRVRGTA